MYAFSLTWVQQQYIDFRKKESGDHLGESEHKDDCHGAIEEHPCDSGHGLEKPVADVRHHAWRNEDLFGHALQVLRRLGGDVVEVDEVADGVDGGEEQGGAGADLVELEAGVEGDVLVEGVLFELGDHQHQHQH